MSQQIKCPVCSRDFDRKEAELHIAEAHSDPEKKEWPGLPEGNTLTEAQFIRMALEKPQEVDVGIDQPITVVPPSTIFEDIGIKVDDFQHVDITTMAGATLTSSESKMLFNALEDHLGFKINRAAFVANFIDWGIRTSFTEELEEAGGFSVPSNPVSGKLQERYMTMLEIHKIVTEYFAAKGTGRSFTVRRFGRFLAPKIPDICDKVEKLKRYYTEGSPMSRRLGVRNKLFLTVTSIYEYIKPFDKWTRDEKAAWEALNRTITKQPRAQDTSFVPQDLRPRPYEAETLVETRSTDFARRHDTDPLKAVFGQSAAVQGGYGKGAEIFEKMRTGSSGSKNA